MKINKYPKWRKEERLRQVKMTEVKVIKALIFAAEDDRFNRPEEFTDVWSIDNQIKIGAKGADWDGVRNYQAANNLKK